MAIAAASAADEPGLLPKVVLVEFQVRATSYGRKLEQVSAGGWAAGDMNFEELWRITILCAGASSLPMTASKAGVKQQD